MSASSQTFASFPSPSSEIEASARARQARLTKPPGSLGVLEELAIQIAAYQAAEVPLARPCSTLLFAADHPVTRHGVSPYPSSVTRAMVANFESGGAAASVLSRAADLPLHVIDAGVAGGLVDREIPAGDLLTEDALTQDAWAVCVTRGSDAVSRHASDNRVTILGEMGIGNTTPAAAVCAALLATGNPTAFVGAGTGARGEILTTKRDVVRRAVERIAGDKQPRSILRRLGGRDMAHLYGAMRRALLGRSIVLVDGFIVTAVAAVLVAEEPGALNGLIFAHRSDEQAHQRVLEHLGVRPLLDLRMRLGEASGALMAYPLLERACQLHNQMATFQSAGVSGPIA